ncbi:MAG: C25 family cysteine peptidase, partial [Anaerolineales bacterium]
SPFRFLATEPMVLGLVKGLAQDSWIWEINDPLKPRQLKGQELTNSDDLRRYLYAPKDSFQAPSDLRFIDAESGMVPKKTEVEYLAIGPQELLTPLKPLLDLRREEGLTVEAIEVEKIYDQSYGFAEPHAIRTYLSHSAQEYPSLRYVLLVGDATYDPAQNITRAGLNRLPTFFIDTIFGGQTSTELPFSVFDQPDLSFLESATSFQPTIAVGRLPATSPQQVRQWVSKVITYEQEKMKPHTKTLLAIADPHEDYFARDATAFTELWTAPMRKELFLPTASEDDLPQKIQGYFQQDYQIIAYFGHGAIDLWGKDEIFTAQEAHRLSGQVSYPIVLSFTCLSGYYIHPEVLSLTEALLWNPRGGAILVIAPTSLTLAEDQSFLWKAFVESYQRHEKERIGDVWRDIIARIHLKNEGVRDVVLTYTLFGDPAMTLP